MKRISLLLLAALLANAAPAADSSEFTRQQSYPDPFSDRAPHGRPPLLPGKLRLTPGEIDSLILPRAGAVHRFPSIDRFTGNESDPLEFRRVSLFAAGARIRVVGDSGEFEQLRPERQYYLANNGSTGIGLAVDPLSGEVSGFVARDGDRLQIQGDFVTQLEFVQIEEAGDGSNSCGNGDHDLSRGAPAVEASMLAMSASAAEAGSSISYQAVVAVDTDTEWLDGFSDDTVAATAWITDLFLAMNVFYERDVETQLLIGDVTLRTGSDPYSVPSDRFQQLSEFGEYWMNNMDAVERQFAALFSGRSISSYGFSGIAWVDAYCENGHWINGGTAVAGSYSYNAIGSNRTPANTALFVGHELGHNMGSPHTHCYSPAVDRCYNGEGGCWGGAVECPAGGRGTVMSYCHVGGANGAGCGTSDSEFHPTVQARIESRLASEMVAGCILPYSGGPTPEPEYQSSPAGGSVVDFGDQTVGGTSPPQSIQVQNVGDDDLTLSCGLSGPDAGDFAVDSCPALLVPAAGGDVDLSCSPGAAGSLQATLTVTTNDADEGQVQYDLVCNGVADPVDDMIFEGSFEN